MPSMRQHFINDNMLREYWSMENALWGAGGQSAPAHLSLNGGILNAAAGYGYSETCFRFDGSNDYLQTTTAFPTSSSAQNYTVMLWIRTSTAPAETVWPFSMSSTGQNQTTRNAAFDITTGGLIEAYNFDGAAKKATSVRKINDGLWHCVACVFDAVNVHLYVDGVVIQKTATTTTRTAYNIPVWSMADAGHAYFNGDIGETGIWARALSANEILEYFENASRPLPNPISRAVPRLPKCFVSGIIC